MTGSQLFWTRDVRVFDLDGTLVDTLPDLAHGLNAALADLGLPAVPARLVQRSLHGGIEGSVQAALRELRAPPALADMLCSRYELHYQAAPARLSRPYPGVPELLERLHLRGQPVAVCTNKPAALARRVLTLTGLAPLVRAVVGADTCVHRKPHPQPLLHALALLDARGQRALLVGDSVVDRDCARAAGVDCLIFGGGYGAAQAEGPPLFEHYAELLLAEPAGRAVPRP